MINWNKYLNISSSRNIKLTICFAGAFFFLGSFLKVTVELLFYKSLKSIDIPTLVYIDQHIRTTMLNGMAVDITALGSASLITIFTLVGLVSLWVKKDHTGAWFLATNVIGAAVWMGILKISIGRDRPEIIPRLVEVSGLSYPSGHSLVSTATYLSFAFLVCRHVKSRRLIGVILFFTALLILMIAFSRLYLGVHYPSDVVSGLCFGLAWVLWITALFKAYQYKKETL